MVRFLIRCLIVFFWMGIIFVFVLMPFTRFLWYGKQSITICTWAGSFDLVEIARFERQSGIRVNVSYYDSNEELFLKLETAKNQGYDLIVPSDYAVHLLRKKGDLKKLDRSKLTFYKDLNPLLLNHYFDPENAYSVPFEWAVFGLGIDKNCYKKGADNTWGLIFDKALIGDKRVVMTSDPLVAIPIAGLYLYGAPNTASRNIFSPQQIKGIKMLLSSQRSWIEAYTDFRASYYIATRNACVAVVSSSYMVKSMRDYPHVDFIIPQEGTLATIESFAIPSSSTKEDLVYAFMNFMMTPESVIHSYEHMGFFPPTLNVLEKLEMPDKIRSLLTMTPEEFKQLHLVRYDLLKKVLTEHEIYNLWIEIKV